MKSQFNTVLMQTGLYFKGLILPFILFSSIIQRSSYSSCVFLSIYFSFPHVTWWWTIFGESLSWCWFLRYEYMWPCLNSCPNEFWRYGHSKYLSQSQQNTYHLCLPGPTLLFISTLFFFPEILKILRVTCSLKVKLKETRQFNHVGPHPPQKISFSYIYCFSNSVFSLSTSIAPETCCDHFILWHLCPIWVWTSRVTWVWADDFMFGGNPVTQQRRSSLRSYSVAKEGEKLNVPLKDNWIMYLVYFILF